MDSGMARAGGRVMSFVAELKRRNVVRVGIAYIVMSWVLLQAGDFALDLIDAPNWVIQSLVIIVALGLPIALFFAWAFELTPEGIKRETQVDRSESLTPKTGRKLDYAIVTGLLLIAFYFIWESRFKVDDTTPAATQSAAREAAPAMLDAQTPESIGNSIAVLPFANRSNQDDDLFFTDGIHDDLLTQLAKLEDLKVISRTSVMEYRDTTRKIADIASDLGVSTILEGGVQRAGERIRINVQLIDVTTDEHLWAETFDRELTIDNIFDIQSEITRQIVTAVRGELSDDEQRILKDRPTDNLAAWEALQYARAIVAEPDYTADKYLRAEPFALEAVTLDPDFAEAWADLAAIQMQGIWIGYANTPQQRDAVRDSLARAEALDPDSAEVKAALADYQYRVEVDYVASLALVNDALKESPGNTELHRDRGLSLRRLGRWEESVEAFQRALELDPLNSFAAATLAETLTMMNAWDRVEPLADFWLRKEPDSNNLLAYKASSMLNRRGDVEGAWEQLGATTIISDGRVGGIHTKLAYIRGDWERAITWLMDPNYIGGLEIFGSTKDLRLGWVYAVKGDLETARSHFETYIDSTREKELTGRIAKGFRDINLAEVYVWLEDTEAVQFHLNRALEFVPPESDHVFGSNIERRSIWVLAKIGQRDVALQRISDKLDQPEGYTRWELHLDPVWDFFRDDPRFVELARPDGVEPEPFRNQRLGDGT